MLRVNRSEFNHILNLIKNDPIFESGKTATQLPIELQLQIALYRFGSNGEGATIRKIASIFGVGDGGTLDVVTNRVIKAINNLKNQFLYWPSSEEKILIQSRTKRELPGCIGYLDGTEIRLAESPSRNHEVFFSRKRQYAVKLQVICDDQLIIRQATYGYPGSFHDSKIFSESCVARSPRNLFSEGEWIAADSAYALSPNVVTPFRNNSNEYTKEMRDKFNMHLSKYRVRVENCFGQLKEKFQSLKGLKFRLHSMENMKQCNSWILTCCILHNIIIKMNMPIHNTLHQGQPDLPQLPFENKRNWLINFINTQDQ